MNRKIAVLLLAACVAPGEPGGPDGFFRVFDTCVTVMPTSALTLGLDVNHTTNEVRREDAALALDGVGGYVRYQVAAPLAAAIRYERLADEGLFGGIWIIGNKTGTW